MLFIVSTDWTGGRGLQSGAQPLAVDLALAQYPRKPCHADAPSDSRSALPAIPRRSRTAVVRPYRHSRSITAVTAVADVTAVAAMRVVDRRPRPPVRSHSRDSRRSASSRCRRPAESPARSSRRTGARSRRRCSRLCTTGTRHVARRAAYAPTRADAHVHAAVRDTRRRRDTDARLPDARILIGVQPAPSARGSMQGRQRARPSENAVTYEWPCQTDSLLDIRVCNIASSPAYAWRDLFCFLP